MITRDPEQIKALKEGGAILARVLRLCAKRAVPGVSAHQLNELAEKELKKLKAESSFKGYKSRPKDPPFPATLTVSINDEVVHGLPAKNKILREGDIVGLDLGVWYKGLCTDAAITVPVGNVSKDRRLLLNAAKQSLANALKRVKAGAAIGDIGFAIESTAQAAGFEVVRELVGHGVGLGVHEDPEIPCYGKEGEGEKLVDGMVLAIEPMLNAGGWKIYIDEDQWTIKTLDGSDSAHFEHTVLVEKNGCSILTQP